MNKLTSTWKQDGKTIFEKTWKKMKKMKKVKKDWKLIDAVIKACYKVMVKKGK